MKLNKANVDTESKTNSKTDEPAAQMKKKKERKSWNTYFQCFLIQYVTISLSLIAEGKKKKLKEIKH